MMNNIPSTRKRKQKKMTQMIVWAWCRVHVGVNIIISPHCRVFYLVVELRPSYVTNPLYMHAWDYKKKTLSAIKERGSFLRPR